MLLVETVALWMHLILGRSHRIQFLFVFNPLKNNVVLWFMDKKETHYENIKSLTADDDFCYWREITDRRSIASDL